ncbi:Repeat domain-containing protein [Rhizobacter sp. OV335]|nr:Repeat domain-containing protein [Rhizobacter sp. OV335]
MSCAAPLFFAAAAAAQSQVTVSNGGTASYEHTIAVPPGIGGMAPQLGLSYSSGNRSNGAVGYGWSLQGVSTLTRCAAVRATDGVHVSVLFNANDKLCLDGERLIPLDASGNPVTGAGKGDAAGLAAGSYREYRTERDSYARIRAYGFADGSNAASGPMYFRVWTKGGRIIDYGNNPETSDVNTSATVGAYWPASQTNHYAQSWAVSRIADIFGNHVDFKYSQRDVVAGSVGAYAPGHEWNLVEVQYSNNKVVFNYIDRLGGAPQDVTESYRGFSKAVRARRLASITTYTNAGNTGALGVNTAAVAVTTAQLVYDIGPVTKRSRLLSINTCAGDASSTRCLPGEGFTYSTGGGESFRKNTFFNLGSLQLYTSPNSQINPTEQFGTKGVVTGDFNGDGRTDILSWSKNPADNKLWWSAGDGSFTQAGNFNITSDLLFSQDGCTQVIAKDFNGDGLVDLLRYFNSSRYSDIPSASQPGCFSAGNSYPLTTVLFINKGDGTFDRKAITGVDLLHDRQPNNSADPWKPDQGVGTWWSEGREFYLLDVDGDGLLDAITTMRPIRPVANAWDPLQNQCANIVCTRVFKGNGQGAFTELASNLAHISLYSNNAAPALGGSALDFDQDGLPDIAILEHSQGGVPLFNYVARSRGDGNFDYLYLSDYPYFTLGPTSIPLDYNGDGQWDVLRASASCTTGACPNQLTVKDTASALYSPVAAFNLTVGGDLFANQYRSSAVGIDMNGDGKQDIVWSLDYLPTLALSNGDGSFTRSTLLNLQALRQADGILGSVTVVGDFTGRGTPEFLVLSAPNALYVKSDPVPPDTLLSVSNMGVVSSMTYVPLANSLLEGDRLGPRYVGDRGTPNVAVLPKQDITPPLYVVATLQTDDGVGGTFKSEYSYGGMKTDTTGRDNLGFRLMRRQTVAPNGAPRTSEIRMLQDFPYIGMPSTNTVYRSALNTSSASNLFSSTTTIYCDQTSVAGADFAAIANGVSCPSGQVIKRPYAAWSRSTGVDLKGIGMPTVTTQATVNANGDPINVTVTTTLTNGPDDTYTQVASTEYWPDNTGCADTQTCTWILSRVKRNAVRAASPSAILSASPGTSANATATAGNSATPTLTPALINLILQILLDD